ncbi:MAG: protein DA1 [Spirochaetales bacterium]|nr:protein DA1 [Spirochaetales bacterium]
MQLTCAHCGKPINGKYLMDHWGNSYCANHLKMALRCDYCGRFMSKKLTGGGKSYPDGRRICGLCLPAAVTDLSEGKKLLESIKEKLENKGITIHPFKPDFYLISRSKLKELDPGSTGGNSEKQGFAAFRRRMVNGQITDFRMEIFILDGLPESSFITACAHELMHIWFYSRNITDCSPSLIEGSCQMAAYLVLSELKTGEAEYRIKELFADRSKVYGGGFKKAHALVSRRGVYGWLKHIETTKRF